MLREFGVDGPQSLLGLAVVISNLGFDVGGGKGPAADLIDLETEFIKEPKFDIDNFSFDMELGIKGDGIISLDNKIAANGLLIDDTFAVTLYTTEDGEDGEDEEEDEGEDRWCH